VDLVEQRLDLFVVGVVDAHGNPVTASGGNQCSGLVDGARK
jgi:hypothetical protein